MTFGMMFANHQNMKTTIAQIIETLEPIGHLVAFRRVRLACPELTKEDFDRQAVELSRAGIIAMHEHDYPHSLTDEARSQLVKFGAEYYVGAEIRRR